MKDMSECDKPKKVLHREYREGPMDITTVDLDVCERCPDLKNCNARIAIKAERAIGFRR